MKRIPLPEAPDLLTGPVKAWSAPMTIPTYLPDPADRNPMFLEKRVFQGSSGRVYPLPFTDRVSGDKVDHAWAAIHLENAYLRVVILPELGGRIYAAVDKVNGYDFIYRNPVIKPALVGLTGPWISGGIEFNWPQHHRPSTFMPLDVAIEEDADGSRTVWLSEHEPMSRMKGMHGVCLRPDRACLEVRVRLYNRTATTQSFMWWANVATAVHERYQSFFPADVRHVADHAKRAISEFPRCDDRYYGIDYAGRAADGVPAAEAPPSFRTTGASPANDLRWYTNIPVPTSYMAIGSRSDFFGGYDHAADAGIVHVADHHIVPGKKQWTWGNHEFGYAWDRNLTDPDENGVYRPYFELMAGAYTDNQPDFSFLAPGETKTFSQYWYPIRTIGPADIATVEAAAHLECQGRTVTIGVQVTARQHGARIALSAAGQPVAEWHQDLEPATPLVTRVTVADGIDSADLSLVVTAADGRCLLAYRPPPREPTPEPADSFAPATEPPAPADIPDTDALYLTGLHLHQYRHATRAPEAYWREALRRDPLDSRCNNALGLWHLARAEFEAAESCFRRAVTRLQSRNPNPPDGEPFYNLGLALRFLGRAADAYDAFYKATWNAAWRAPACHALAELDAARGQWHAALDHLDDSLRSNVDNLRARDLKVICLRRLGREPEAQALLEATLALDPLDFWARALRGHPITDDGKVRLDLAIDHAGAGLFDAAYELLDGLDVPAQAGAAPLVHYYAACYAGALGRDDAARRHRALAKAAPTDYCFPSRIDDVPVLQAAIRTDTTDARALYYLGNLFYDRRRHREAITLWERAVQLDPSLAIAWRNLGIGYYNILRRPDAAVDAYDQAVRYAPDDARILFERDQLWKRTGRSPAQRLALLLTRTDLVARRDDLSVERAALHNQTGQPAEALTVLLGRRFQPWEGGEGLALGQYVRTRLALGRTALAAGDATGARREFSAALSVPPSLGEARHLLANQSDIYYWLGVAAASGGDGAAADAWWQQAAAFTGDFRDMAVHPISEKTLYSALAMRKRGDEAGCLHLLYAIRDYANRLAATEAKIDYFATSLPTMLIFDDDLQERQTLSAWLMTAQAEFGLNHFEAAAATLEDVLRRDPNHPEAADLLTEIRNRPQR
ncbi:MAG: DUF5107 domain-containing protein [Azospirillaceae bacterium]|nr:DUF5107 domain-containing protein [Azospirillaceae bacterium]